MMSKAAKAEFVAVTRQVYWRADPREVRAAVDVILNPAATEREKEVAVWRMHDSKYIRPNHRENDAQ